MISTNVIIIICIIAAGTYAIYTTKNEKLKYLIILATILLLLFMRQHENFLDYASLTATKSPMYKPLPVSYADRDLSSLNANCGNLKQPCNVPLLKQVDITSPVGEDIPLSSDPVSYSFPHVDGTPNSPQSLFMLSHNQSSFACCPSTFSDDRGCVCLTQAQRNMFAGRGGNSGAGSEY